MAYTRTYPLAVTSYNPGNNPVLKGNFTVTAGSSDVDVSGANAAAAQPGWIVSIVGGPDTAIWASYTINAIAGNTFTLDDLLGNPWVAPPGSSGTYSYYLFDPAVPNGNDLLPEAFVLTVDDDIDVILTSGQYVSYPLGTFIVGAIYQIGILEVIAINGAAGYLLGTVNSNGTAYR
jgi:hypothetical protein